MSGSIYARILDPPDQTDEYNTELTAAGERLFQQQMAGRQADLRDYDLRGAWLSNAEQTAGGHLPDTYKKPAHPTFSMESRYSTPANPGGSWAAMPGNAWAFLPGPHNAYGDENLRRYFERVEPGNFLIGRQR